LTAIESPLWSPQQAIVVVVETNISSSNFQVEPIADLLNLVNDLISEICGRLYLVELIGGRLDGVKPVEHPGLLIRILVPQLLNFTPLGPLGSVDSSIPHVNGLDGGRGHGFSGLIHEVRVAKPLVIFHGHVVGLHARVVPSSLAFRVGRLAAFPFHLVANGVGVSAVHAAIKISAVLIRSFTVSSVK